MKNNEEKEIVKVNENSIFYKIKMFFKNIFKKKEENSAVKEEAKTIKPNASEESNNQQSEFMISVKTIEDDETRLLKLQKQYRNGEIKEEDMTEEQVQKLCDLYDRQISELEKSNEARKKKLLEYRRKMKKA